MTRRLQTVQLAIAATNAVEGSRLFSFIRERRGWFKLRVPNQKPLTEAKASLTGSRLT
jgi:hypothetical protein